MFLAIFQILVRILKVIDNCWTLGDHSITAGSRR